MLVMPSSFTGILNLSLSCFCTWRQVKCSRVTKNSVDDSGSAYEFIWDNELPWWGCLTHSTITAIRLNATCCIYIAPCGLGHWRQFRGNSQFLSNLAFHFPIAFRNTVALISRYCFSCMLWGYLHSSLWVKQYSMSSTFLMSNVRNHIPCSNLGFDVWFPGEDNGECIISIASSYSQI